MSTLDLKSGYFQLAISPKDIEKTAFITRNVTFALLRMPFGAEFPKGHRHYTETCYWAFRVGLYGRYYYNISIVQSTLISFDPGICIVTRRRANLNKEKCIFARDKLKYLGLIIIKEGIETDNSKVKTIAEMEPP
ncbi:hypothetical protein TNCV_4272881 [Trichonephila clavipes]|nr:hypothetical protein TNCV_4272881 [Trichonephila clavipes]